MKIGELVVLSGKGGAGKTSFVAAFSRLVKDRAIFVDADVDASDLFLLMEPSLIKETPFPGPKVPQIDRDKCTMCGLCHQLCRFDAISEDIQFDLLQCEGCAVCSNFCPVNAIEMVQVNAGKWFVSNTPYGILVHAHLNPGGENSGKLVAVVRQAAKKLAEETKKEYILIDGPPGVGCPAISTLTGTHLVLLIVEATSSGLHDAIRATDLAHHFQIPVVAVINKYDLNLPKTSQIEKVLQEKKAEVIGKIPYDESFYKALVRGKSIMDIEDASPYILQTIESVWSKIEARLRSS